MNKTKLLELMDSAVDETYDALCDMTAIVKALHEERQKAEAEGREVDPETALDFELYVNQRDSMELIVDMLLHDRRIMKGGKGVFLSYSNWDDDEPREDD